MKFGLLLNTQFPAGESASKRLEGLLDQVRAARDNGLHSVWVSQHYLATPFQMLQQLPVLGRLAAEAGSMQRRHQHLPAADPQSRVRGGAGGDPRRHLRRPLHLRRAASATVPRSSTPSTWR